MKWQDTNKAILATFIVVHLICICLLSKTGYQPQYLLWLFGIYAIRWMGFTCAVHRYFSHKVCRTSRWFQFVLGIWGTLTMARSPIRFASGHRHHHLYSDSDKDLHSYSKQGFVYSYIGWVVSKRYDEKVLRRVRDLTRYPELVWLNRLYFVPNLALFAALYAMGGLPALAYGGFASAVLTWHVAFSATVLFHVIGQRPNETGDNSCNSLLLALFTFGEGWHNNHHANMNSAKLGHEWWQIDLGYYLFVFLEKIGLVWDLNRSTVAPMRRRVPDTKVHPELARRLPDLVRHGRSKAA